MVLSQSAHADRDRDRANASAKALYEEAVRHWYKWTIALFILSLLVNVALVLLCSRKLLSTPLMVGGFLSINSLLVWSRTRYRTNERLLHIHTTLLGVTLLQATTEQKDRILDVVLQAVDKPDVLETIKSSRQRRNVGRNKPSEPPADVQIS